MTSFVKMVPPVGDVALQYPLDKPSTTPPSSIPAGFADSMVVRKEVFVIEQGCRLELEVDEDDKKSYHWVVYASIAHKAHPEKDETVPDDSMSQYQHLKRIGGSVPIGTLRLVPPPHPPHPLPGSIDGVGGQPSPISQSLRTASPVQRVVYGGDQATALHDGKELYVKIGRMATVSDFRGLGLGKLLMTKAMDWAEHNQKALSLIPDDVMDAYRLNVRLGGKRSLMEWHGLVMVHSQKNAVRFYEKLGFVEDKELGSWIEEGIEHVAMWKRIPVQKQEQEIKSGRVPNSMAMALSKFTP